ncbi:MAG TPA: zinc-ribbon domain-containing protein [Terriglobales bacterium]|nr:zinc-ribbon domain-containing protein [Terriglobales bacterium]
MAFCSACGAQLSTGATVCPACNKAVGSAPIVTGTTGGLADNIAGMLAYVTIIPAIIFLVIEPTTRASLSGFIPFNRFFSSWLSRRFTSL